MFLRGFARIERPQISSLTVGIFFTRVESVLVSGNLSDHVQLLYIYTKGQPRSLARLPGKLAGPSLSLFLDSVASSVANLIAIKMRGINAFAFIGPFAARRHRSLVTVIRMKAIIHVAAEVSATVEPGASANEHAAVEPFRAVIARWCASVRSYVVITVRAIGSGAYININTNLGGRLGSHS